MQAAGGSRALLRFLLSHQAFVSTAFQDAMRPASTSSHSPFRTTGSSTNPLSHQHQRFSLPTINRLWKSQRTPSSRYESSQQTSPGGQPVRRRPQLPSRCTLHAHLHRDRPLWRHHEAITGPRPLSRGPPLMTLPPKPFNNININMVPCHFKPWNGLANVRPRVQSFIRQESKVRSLHDTLSHPIPSRPHMEQHWR